MNRPMTSTRIQQENIAFKGTGGVSGGNRSHRFRPAFLDFATMTIYPSRFADGRPAPCHLLDGLPDEAVQVRRPDGRVARAKCTVISGFERDGFFYTRRAAARAVEQWRMLEADDLREATA
jgi:hypothetical protein